MKIITFFYTLLICTVAFCEECTTCTNRVDVGPAFASIDMLESGKTVRTRDIWGVRADGTFLIYKGFCIKPAILLADGDANLNIYSIGIGFCFPVCKTLTLTPSYGYSHTDYQSRISFPEFGLNHLKEKFHSNGQYIALDGCWTFIPGCRVYLGAQWAWSVVRTTVKPLFKSRQHCKGPNYAGCLEYDLTPNWSINVAGAYNLSLSKEKHGLRGKGAKVGLVYWY